MKLSNQWYDVLKWIDMVFLPALTTFVGVILNCFHVEGTEVILTLMVGFTAFLGALLGISNINYTKGMK